MDPTDRQFNAIRQMVQTDHLLGLDAVPLGQLPDAADEPPAADGATHDETKSGALAHLEQEMTAWLEQTWERNGWSRVVFGEGDADADIMFIGEGPGADEDRQGRPFVGRAGQLLDRQIAAMGLERQQVYITNIVKTRPPGNRVPTPEEAARCMPYLERQIEIIQPKAIITLGATAAKYLLDDSKIAITRARGQWRQWRDTAVMPTFHPAYLLRQYTPDNRRRVWDDLKKVMQHVGLPVSDR
jgi:DNA polymerase